MRRWWDKALDIVVVVVLPSLSRSLSLCRLDLDQCFSSFSMFMVLISLFLKYTWLSHDYSSVSTLMVHEEDKNRRWGLMGLTGPYPWAKRKSSPSLVWNPWWNKGPIWIGQSIGKILRKHLKDRGLFTLNNLSTTFRIPKGRVLQGNNLGYKERRQNLTTIKAPIPPHIKVRIIDPSLAL